MNPDAAAELARALRGLYGDATVAHVLATDANTASFAAYRDRPVDFCREVLGVTLTPDQCAIITAKGRVKVNSGHSIGKTMLAACKVIHWHVTRNPSVVIVTAPKQQHIETVMWAEIRLLAARARRPLNLRFMPRAAKIWDNPEHWAEGFTAARGESYQGRHRPSMLFVFDECEGLEAVYWNAVDTMFQPDGDHGWLAIGNPITTSSQSYLEDRARSPDGSPKWRLFVLSALNHPNIAAQLTGRPPPVPEAVTVGMVEQWIGQWTTPVDRPEDRQTGDIEWPPSAVTGRPGRFYRPGPTFKARVLGLRPTSGVDTCWSEDAFELACQSRWTPESIWLRRYGVTIGCDPAFYGDDDTVLHVRAGPLSLHHEARNGWGHARTASRIKELAEEWSAWYNQFDPGHGRPPLTPYDVEVVIEFDGGGSEIASHAGEYMRWKGFSSGGASNRYDSVGNPLYYNQRAEMWLEGAAAAVRGEMDISRLPQEIKDRLRVQLLTPYYEVRPGRGKLVESKELIKERLLRSPDDADGLLISHFQRPVLAPSLVLRGGRD